MRRHLLKIAWICLLTCAALAIVAVRTGAIQLSMSGVGFTVVAVSCLVLFLFLSLRVYRFLTEAQRFVEQLLDGNYHARVVEAIRVNDEMTEIRKLMNKLAERLKTYDELREDHVRLSNRALDILFANIEEPVLLIKVNKDMVRLNPPACRLFDIEESTLSLDALAHLKDNEDFMQLFKELCQVNRSPMTGLVLLCVPARSCRRRVKVEMMPVKDRDETVQTVLVFVQPEQKKAPAK